MKLEQDPLYPLIAEAHRILPEASIFEFIDEEESEIKSKLRQYGLKSEEFQNRYLRCLEQIRNSE